MQFTHNNNTQYRLYRGVGTGNWILLTESETTSGQWRILDYFDAGVDEADIQDRAKASLDFQHTQEYN